MALKETKNKNKIRFYKLDLNSVSTVAGVFNQAFWTQVLRPFLSSCWVAFGRPSYLWAVLLGVPRHWRVPPASGGHPSRLLPPSGRGLLPGAWGAPKRGVPTGSKVFLALPDACGLRPCDWAHLKNGLVRALCHIRALVGRMINNLNAKGT